MTRPSLPRHKILLLTKPLDPAPAGGRELLCKLNHDALKAIYGDRLVVFELPAGKLQGTRAYLNAFRGHIDGLSTDSIAAVLRMVDAGHIAKVFVDGSNLGAIVPELKQRVPQVEVISFFHNVEARFFWGSLRLQRSMRALAVLVANTLAERQAVRYSDKIVCLSERDSRLLKRIYGRGATHIAPMALEDKLPANPAFTASAQPESFALFVGGTFYANRAGIAWFVRHVAPRIDVPVFIVGRGFEALREKLEIPGQVTVIGTVDDLADWYRRAQFVIAPIFDGSGMKTKVAEALMFGKKVVGTPEAFSGYEGIAADAGWVCRSADDFVAAIGEAQATATLAFDPALRALYLEKYSLAAATERMKSIMH